MIKLKIYIVEDEAILATLLKYTLQNLGHCVCGIAESYTDAVRDLQKTEADLIISDIMLKGDETGIDIARYNRANLNIPFMFLSSVNDDEIIKEAMNTGPVAYLKKPLNKDYLSIVISEFSMMNLKADKANY